VASGRFRNESRSSIGPGKGLIEPLDFQLKHHKCTHWEWETRPQARATIDNFSAQPNLEASLEVIQERSMNIYHFKEWAEHCLKENKRTQILYTVSCTISITRKN
jgi:hypothetical protein